MAAKSDMKDVKEVLSAATRGPRDPDLELAVKLFELSDSDDTPDVEAALAQLAHSVRSNTS